MWWTFDDPFPGVRGKRAGMRLVWVLLGFALSTAVLVDVWLTIFHPDAEGPIAATVRRLVWRAVSLAGRHRDPPRRTALVLAGPVVVTATFLLWVVVLVVGTALLVWPYLDAYRTADGVVARDFNDALYYAGGTLTVLGYGDITPDTGLLKLFSVILGAVGFAMFTALVTYLIQLVGGLELRNRLALAVYDQTREQDGAGLLLRSLTEEGVDAAVQRCRDWAASLREVEDTTRRYPLVALTFRPRRPDYDLEPALEHLAEATAVALLAGCHQPWRALRLSAEELAHALLRLQDTIARRYLPDIQQAPEHGRQLLQQLRERITEQTGCRAMSVDDELAGHVVSRSLEFSDTLRAWAAPGVRLHDRRSPR